MTEEDSVVRFWLMKVGGGNALALRSVNVEYRMVYEIEGSDGASVADIGCMKIVVVVTVDLIKWEAAECDGTGIVCVGGGLWRLEYEVAVQDAHVAGR